MLMTRRVALFVLLVLALYDCLQCGTSSKKTSVRRLKPMKNVRDDFRLTNNNEPPSAISNTVEKLTDFIKYEASVVRNVAKSALDLISVKHVSFLQVVGKWKIYQEINVGSDDDVLSYPVSIELHENGTVTTRRNGEEFSSSFKFTERQWPQKCSIEFQLNTYDSSDGGAGASPLLYKGYFKRSLLNKFIVIMKGSLYKTTGRSFWKQTQKVGKFKASKRRYA